MHPHKKISKLGLGLGFVYLIVTAGMIVYGVVCEAAFCQLILVVPIIPWFTFFEGLPYSPLWYPLAVIFNTLIIYLLGGFMARLYVSHKEKRELESY